MIKKNIKISSKNLLLIGLIIFLIIGIIYVSVGLFHMFGFDKDSIVPKQDLETYRFSAFGEDLVLHVEAYLKPEYNLLYSFDRVPVQLSLELIDCMNCTELDEGIPFWFFYEKIDGQGSGGSFCSDNFYSIVIKPGEEKIINGWITFTGEGLFRHGLVDNNLDGIHIRLVATNKNFTVYGSHILHQIKNSRAINTLTYIAVGASFFVLTFVCFQSYNNIENQELRKKDTDRLLRKLNDINKSINNLKDKK